VEEWRREGEGKERGGKERRVGDGRRKGGVREE